MSDKALYRNDMLHREPTFTFTETIVDDRTKVEFKDGATVVHEAFQPDIIDAYRLLRADFLDGENPIFLSTSTERDALTNITIYTAIHNLTVGRTEVWNGIAWINVTRRAVVSGITASTTQTQGEGLLTGDINVVSTVVNNNDTVTLTSAIAGLTIVIINQGDKRLQIFPFAGDDLGQGLDNSIIINAGTVIVFYSADDTNWVST